MSEEHSYIKLYCNKGALSEGTLRDIFLYPSKIGYNFSQTKINQYGNALAYVEKVVNDSFTVDKSNVSGLEYEVSNDFFETSFRNIDDKTDMISIQYPTSALNPWNLSDGSRTLDDVYALAEDLIDYSTHIWNTFGKKALLGVGGSFHSFFTNYSSSKLDDLVHLTITSKPSLYDLIGCYWINFVPPTLLPPKKWANGVPSKSEIKPDFMYGWFKVKELSYGTLLVQSKLPSDVSISPDDNRKWEEMEKIWRHNGGVR